MRRNLYLVIFIVPSIFVSSCGGISKEETVETMVAETFEAIHAKTETREAIFLLTPSATNTFVPTSTFTPTNTFTPTSTSTFTPTSIFTPTATIAPTSSSCAYTLSSLCYDHKGCATIKVENKTGENARISLSGDGTNSTVTIPSG